MLKSLMFCAVFLIVAGCAGVEHKPIAYTRIPSTQESDDAFNNAIKANRTADHAATGIRYYQSAPYLLVYSDGKNGLGWKVIYLPDLTKKMSAEPSNFFSKIDTTLTFDSGVLTSSNTIGEGAAVPKAIIAAVEQLIPFVAAAAGGGKTLSETTPKELPVPAPRLYKIIVRGNVVEFHGGRSVPQTVFVTLVPPAKGN
jgi:hypothetical protein